MRLEIHNATVSLGGKEILSHIDFEVRGREKIGIVGPNGSGKTTFLRMLAGELTPDRDDKRQGPVFTTDRDITKAMLTQTLSLDPEMTVEELVLAEYARLNPQTGGDLFAPERFVFEQEFDRMLTGLGLKKEVKGRKIGSFSGGEQTRLSLIRLLLSMPDLLILDEPTNHLDMEAVGWLEEYLTDYPKAVVFVSHDRFFLDRIAEVIYEVDRGRLRRYAGNYTAYREEKYRKMLADRKAYERRQEELERQNALIERFKNKPKKAAFARSRKKIIERMELMEKPSEDEAYRFEEPIEPQVPGSKWMLETELLKIGYEKPVAEISFRLKKGQKIGIIGPNGAGKTSFLKTVAGLLAPLDGKCTLGNRTTIGYFDQKTAEIRDERAVVEHFHDLFPAWNEKDVRTTLAKYRFRGKDASVKVSSLSGGEKSRLLLAELLCAGPNFLLLDEPTNHMDLAAKETLESAFKVYAGTMLIVSHDRYLIDKVADALLVIEGGKVLYYPFSYSHYIERLKKAKEQGGDIGALIAAEDQALIADMRAVPKAERHESRPLGTEEAYVDWQMRLCMEEFERAESVVIRMQEELDRLKLSEQPDENAIAQLSGYLEDAIARLTEKCVAYYDIINEYI